MVDESLQQRVADRLTEAGYDTVHVGALGLLGASDDDVLAAAAREERILVTADTDFGTLLALPGLWGPAWSYSDGPGGARKNGRRPSSMPWKSLASR
ncbi:MAG: DUF5615 family PIN-like protein [Egibacteraceae bacterium]